MTRRLTARYPIPSWFILATLVLTLVSFVVKGILAVTTYELEQDKLWAIELLGKGWDIKNRPLYGLDAPIWYKMLKRTDAKIGFAADAVIILGCLWILSWKNSPPTKPQ